MIRIIRVDNMKNKKDVFITNSFEETQALGEKVAKNLKGGGILALYGNLGDGKTTFVQGLAKGLGIKRRIISPTFIIVRSYATKLKSQSSKIKATIQNSKVFYHIDLYRIDSQRDVEGLGIEEIINDPKNIVAIEWAEKMGKLLPKKRWDIKFEYLDEGRRKITIINYEK
ncbi:MAG: tRNA (adenosine(37)-N6)-threonylcarbamoyltransferase complex ATPase subunit type 1 TsaE [Candidatus Levybacteria bacterium]|nr:tRNA (adenosine(37)-N6)-threonylcarbamoyltransferase complex ATPase subunit type 1 TsaE [Candidatus Levybacteria bacterium]